MSKAAWDPTWFDTSGATRDMAAWRGVEAQHVVSTMRLVDSLAEQAELERLLETSKPALPAAASNKHYLLSTPFRYRPVHASRFRKAGTLGLWYGAASLQTACAEVAYWRWRFLLDSAGLLQQALHTQHTFFEAQVQGACIDLTARPWSKARTAWTHGHDYSATQTVAAAARERAVQWIRYQSVRDPQGHCAAVLDVHALNISDPPSQQTWHCKTTRSTVLLVHGSDRFAWDF
jgi:RES domain